MATKTTSAAKSKAGKLPADTTSAAASKAGRLSPYSREIKRVERGGDVGVSALALPKPTGEENAAVELPKAASANEARNEFSSFVNTQKFIKNAADRYTAQTHDTVREPNSYGAYMLGDSKIVDTGRIPAGNPRAGINRAQREIDEIKYSGKGYWDPGTNNLLNSLGRGLTRAAQGYVQSMGNLGQGIGKTLGMDDYAADVKATQDRWTSALQNTEFGRQNAALAEAAAQRNAYADQLKAATARDLARQAMSNGDFSSGSKYNPNLGNDNDFDINYETVNNSRRYQTQLLGEMINGGNKVNRNYAQLTPEETAVYNYYYNKGDKETAQAYLDGLYSDLEKRRYESDTAKIQEYATENPVAASIASPLIGSVSGVTAVPGIVDQMKTGRVNPYASYNSVGQMAQTARSTVADNIANSGVKGAGVLSWIYQTGESILENAARTAALGGMGAAVGQGLGLTANGVKAVAGNMSLIPMALGVYQNTVTEAKLKGRTDEEATALGIVAAGAEYLTENISFDKLFDAYVSAKHGTGDAFRRWVSQMATEGMEEGASNIINNIADILILGDRSEWSEAVRKYQAEGETEENARKKAFLEKAGEFGLDVLGGVISGGVMAGPALALDASVRGAAERQNRVSEQTKSQVENARQQAEAAQAEAKEGANLSSEEWEASRKDQSDAAKKRRAALRASAAEHGVDEDTIRTMEAVSDTTGRNYIWYTEKGKSGIEDGHFDEDTGDVYINTESKQPLAFVIGHELTHSTEGSAAYKTLREFALKHLKEIGVDVDARRQRIRNTYEEFAKEQHKNIDFDKYDFDAEIVANYVGYNLLQDASEIENFVNARHDVAQRVWNWINDRLTRIAGDGALREQAMLTRARELYGRALTQARPAEENAPQNTAQAPAQAAAVPAPAQTPAEGLQPPAAGAAAPAQAAPQNAPAQNAQAQARTPDMGVPTAGIEEEDYDETGDEVERMRSVMRGADLTDEEGNAKYSVTPKDVEETREYIDSLPEQKKFSVSTPVEKMKTDGGDELIAVHNVDPADFLHTMEQYDGFPAWSLAVMKPGTKHSGFGRISVIFKRSAADPQADSRNKLYAGDAWTGTFGSLTPDEMANADAEYVANKIGNKTPRRLDVPTFSSLAEAKASGLLMNESERSRLEEEIREQNEIARKASRRPDEYMAAATKTLSRGILDAIDDETLREECRAAYDAMSDAQQKYTVAKKELDSAEEEWNNQGGGDWEEYGIGIDDEKDRLMYNLKARISKLRNRIGELYDLVGNVEDNPFAFDPDTMTADGLRDAISTYLTDKVHNALLGTAIDTVNGSDAAEAYRENTADAAGFVKRLLDEYEDIGLDIVSNYTDIKNSSEPARKGAVEKWRQLTEKYDNGVNYFEAKPARVLGFGEVAGVALPTDHEFFDDDYMPRIKEILDEKGIPYEYYMSDKYDPDFDIPGTRVDVVNRIASSVADAKFSITPREQEDVDSNAREAEPMAKSPEGDTLTEELRGGTVTKYSLTSWNDTDKTAVLQSLIDAGFTWDDANDYIKDVNSIAAIIAGDRDRLDYDAAENQVYMKPNSEYVVTLDASTLCAKRLTYQGTINKIMHRLGNRVLMPEDLIELSNMMAEDGYQTPCGICYVESRRRNLSKYASEWLEGYNGEYIPALDEVTTTDGLEKLRKEHPQTYADFNKAMNSKAQNSPKVVQLRTDYRGDLKKLTPGNIKKILRIGGLRIQSFSDFETPHLIDTMQAVLDMSARKLTAQAYTKVPNFAWVFGDTGIKINLSLIGDIDAEGNLTFSSVEGMDFDEAMKVRDRYSKNVGTILVGKNDAHIIAAMGDDRIDFIIPFHRSGWTNSEFELMKSLRGYEDYTNYENERRIIGRNKNGTYKTAKIEEGNYYPIDYWDYNLSGTENAEIYLKMCAEDSRMPKFSQFLVDNGDGTFSLPQGNDERSAAIRKGYWKTLIDFKMYDNNGVGAPQNIVAPVFNMDEARRVLSEYEGGANKLPSASDEFIDKYIDWYDENHGGEKYSVTQNVTPEEDEEYLRAARAGDTETAQRMVDEAAQRAGYDTVYVYYRGDSAPYNVLKTAAELEDGEGDDDHGNLGNGLYFTPDRSYAERFARNGVLRKFYLKSDMADLEDPDTRSLLMAIKEEIEDESGYFSRDELYSRLMEDTGTNGIKAKGVGGFSGGVAREAIVQESWQAKLADPITYDDNGEIIPLSERFNPENDDIRYSITPAENAEYMKAAEAGDEETAGRMVADAANRAFPKSKVRSDDGRLKRMFHGTNANVEYTVFDIDKTKNGLYGKGFYFTDNAKIANEYTGKENGKKPRVYSAYLDIKNPLIMENDADAAKWLMALPELRDYVWDEDSEELKVKTNHEFYRAAQKYFEDNGYDKEDFGWDMLELLENMGYDGINHIGGKFRKSSSVKHNVWIAFRPEQIKSAEPITYDDDGEIIPLNERFNPEEEDIRYSVTPNAPGDQAEQDNRLEPAAFAENLKAQFSGQPPQGASQELTDKDRAAMSREAPVRSEREQALDRAAADAFVRHSNGDIAPPSANDTEGQKKMFDTQYAAAKKFNKAMDRHKLSKTDMALVRDLMAGVKTPEFDYGEAQNPGGVQEVFETLVEADRANRTVEAYKDAIHDDLTNTAREKLGNVDSFKDKRAGILYGRETQERNIRDIAPEADAEAIIAEYFDPVHVHTMQAKQLSDEYTRRVNALKIDTKKRHGNKDSENVAIQYIGEIESIISELEEKTNAFNRRVESQSRKSHGKYGGADAAAQGGLGTDPYAKQPRKYGMTLDEYREALAKFKKDNPNLNYDEIHRKIAEMQKIYGELYDRLNEVYMRWGYPPMGKIKNYFPHFMAHEDGILNKIGGVLGFDQSAQGLPAYLAGLTKDFKPGRQWFANAMRRMTNYTEYDTLRGFDRYIEKAADIIYHTEDIQKLRAYANTIRYLSTDAAMEEKIRSIRNNKTLSEDEKQAAIGAIYSNKAMTKYNLANYVQNVDEYVNTELANKRSSADRWLEENFGRSMIYGAIKSYQRLRVRSAVQGNITSALTNIIPVAQVSGVAGIGTTSAAYLKTIGNMVRTMFGGHDTLREGSVFLQNRQDYESAIPKTMLNRLGDVASFPFAVMDRLGSETVWRALYDYNRRHGMSHETASALADKRAADIVADRSKGALPTLFMAHNPLINIFSRFMVEQNNTVSYLKKDVPRYFQGRKLRTGLAYAIIAMMSWLFNEGFEALFGRRPAQDALGIVNDLVGDISGYKMPNVFRKGGELISEGRLPTAEDFETEKKTVGGTIKNTAGNVIDQAPFSGAVGTLLDFAGIDLDLQGGRFEASDISPDIPRIIGVAKNEAPEENLRQVLAEELSKPVTGMLPAGNQIQKTAKGVATMIAGGSYKINDKGEKLLQYPAEKNPSNWARAAIAGKSALPTAQDWVQNGFDTLNAKDTALYDSMTGAYNVKPKEAIGILKDLNGLEGEKGVESKEHKQRKMIVNSGIDPDAKLLLYQGKGLATKAEEAVISDLGPENINELLRTFDTLRDTKKTDEESGAHLKREVIVNSKLTGDTKLSMYNNIMLDSDNQNERDLLTDLGRLCDKDELVKAACRLKDGDTISDIRTLLDSKLPSEVKEQLYNGLVDKDDQEKIADFRSAGMSFEQFLSTALKYKEINKEDLTAGQKATEFSYWADQQGGTREQKQTIDDTFKYWQQIPAKASGYDKAVDTGLPADKAYSLSQQLAELAPKEGKSSVSDVQKAQVVASQADLSEEEKLKALRAVYSESENSTYSKAYVANMYGVPLEDYFKIVDKCLEVDADPKYKDYKAQERTAAVLNSFKSLTNKQRAAIWQVYNTGWVAKNNPYDSSVGAYVRSLYYEADGKTKKETLPGGLSRSGSSSASASAELTPPKATASSSTSSASTQAPAKSSSGSSGGGIASGLMAALAPPRG